MTELLDHHFFLLNAPAGVPASSFAKIPLILGQGKRNWKVVCKLTDHWQHSEIGSWPVVSWGFVCFPISRRKTNTLCLPLGEAPVWWVHRVLSGDETFKASHKHQVTQWHVQGSRMPLPAPSFVLRRCKQTSRCHPRIGASALGRIMLPCLVLTVLITLFWCLFWK